MPIDRDRFGSLTPDALTIATDTHPTAGVALLAASPAKADSREEVPVSTNGIAPVPTRLATQALDEREW